MHCSPSGSSVHGIFQARIPEWVVMPSSRRSSWPRDRTHISYVFCIDRQVFYHLCHQGSPFMMTTKKITSENNYGTYKSQLQARCSLWAASSRTLYRPGLCRKPSPLNNTTTTQNSNNNNKRFSLQGVPKMTPTFDPNVWSTSEVSAFSAYH